MSRSVALVTDASKMLASSSLSSAPSLVSLPHPRNGQAANFCVTENAQLWEVQVAKRDMGSWFIDNHVEANGSLLLVTPVDSLFLLLQVLSQSTKAKEGFVSLSQALYLPDFPAMLPLSDALKKRAGVICEVNEAFLEDGHLLVKLSLAKVQRWLLRKVKHTARALRESATPLLFAATSNASTFNTIEPVPQNSNCEHQKMERRESERVALQLLSEYVARELFEPVAKQLSFTWTQLMSAQSITKNAAASSGNVSSSGPDTKRSWEESNGYSAANSDYLKYTQGMPSKNSSVSKGNTSATKKPKVSVVQRRLQQVDKRGMKSLTSFFGTAPAKKNGVSK